MIRLPGQDVSRLWVTIPPRWRRSRARQRAPRTSPGSCRSGGKSSPRRNGRRRPGSFPQWRRCRGLPRHWPAWGSVRAGRDCRRRTPDPRSRWTRARRGWPRRRYRSSQQVGSGHSEVPLPRQGRRKSLSRTLWSGRPPEAGQRTPGAVEHASHREGGCTGRRCRGERQDRQVRGCSSRTSGAVRGHESLLRSCERAQYSWRFSALIEQQ